jgi:hypothetical protein
MRMTSTKAIAFNRWLILVCINCSVPVAILWKYHAGEVTSAVAVLSGAIVLTIGNIVALFGFERRSDRDGIQLKKGFVISATLLAIASFLAILLGVSLVKHRNEYADLAMSNTPLAQIRPERKRLIVELIRRTAAISREENTVLAEAQKVPMNPQVYSPESFANKQTMEATLAQLTKYAEIDFKYFDEQKGAREDFRRKMADCDAEYLKEWNADRKAQEDSEASANRLEHDWFASVSALYLFAEQNAGEITVKDEKTSISNPAVRVSFDDDLFAKSKALHEKLESTAQDEIRQQNQVKERIGE